MPQKRRTKAVRHSRTKPKMLAGSEIHGLTAQQKREKLDILLSDFDAEGILIKLKVLWSHFRDSI